MAGKIKSIQPPVTFPSGFVKREFVLTTDEMYSQEIKFDLIKDKIELLDRFSVGDAVKVRQSRCH